MNMNIDIMSFIPYICTVVISIVGAYFALQKDLALAKQRIENLEKRTDSLSLKLDDVLNGVTDIKNSLSEIKTELKYKEDKK